MADHVHKWEKQIEHHLLGNTDESSYRNCLTWPLVSSGLRAQGNGVGTHTKVGLVFSIKRKLMILGPYYKSGKT